MNLSRAKLPRVHFVEVNGVKLLAAKVEGVDMNGLRDLGDKLKEQLGEGVVLLAAVNDGKVNLLAMATDAAQKAGAHAGNLIKAVAAADVRTWHRPAERIRKKPRKLWTQQQESLKNSSQNNKVVRDLQF